MGKWMDAQVDMWRYEWIDGCSSGWMHGKMMEAQVDIWRHEWMDARVDRWMQGCTDIGMDIQNKGGSMNGWTHKQMMERWMDG